MSLLKLAHPLPRPGDSRADPFTQLRVEQALARQQREGTKAAAKALAAFGVPLDVAHRVLTKPARRRARQRWTG
jgi:hypothetical protein